jgi:hypothetical protein
MPLTIISLIKQVPLPSEMRMGEDGLMDRTKAKYRLSVWSGSRIAAQKTKSGCQTYRLFNGTRFLRNFAKNSDFNGI